MSGPTGLLVVLPSPLRYLGAGTPEAIQLAQNIITMKILGPQVGAGGAGGMPGMPLHPMAMPGGGMQGAMSPYGMVPMPGMGVGMGVGMPGMPPLPSYGGYGRR